MYFVPVKKLSKMLSLRRVSAIQESRQRHSRGWLFFITAVLICVNVVFYHKSPQKVFFIEQHVSADNTNMIHNPISSERNDKRRLTQNLFSEVKLGGYYFPKKYRSRHKVAILVPYRNRGKNLDVFVYHMHPFLIKQQLEYRIFVIEQAGNEKFNRGKLLNIGFKEMMKYNDWHCVVLHDVDFLPLSDKILYTCPIFPRHMLGLVIEKANLSYNQYHILFGGVSALSVQHYKLINGFSNLYWGWGGEDNDMYWRILSEKLPMIRYRESVARYKSLPHAEQPRNNYRYQLLKFAVTRYKTDGLSSLVYKVIWTKYTHLYTHVLADVNPLRENITEVYSKMF